MGGSRRLSHERKTGAGPVCCKDQHGARLDASSRNLTELAKGNDSLPVRFDLASRSARIRQVLVLVCDVEEIERIARSGHGRLAESDSKGLEPALTMSALGQILRQPPTAGLGRLPKPDAKPPLTADPDDVDRGQPTSRTVEFMTDGRETRGHLETCSSFSMLAAASRSSLASRTKKSTTTTSPARSVSTSNRRSLT